VDKTQEHEVLTETSENNFQCAECGREKDTDQARMLRGGGAVCEDCAEEYNFVSCDSCLYYFRYDQLLLACSGCVSFNKQSNTAIVGSKDKNLVRKIKPEESQTDFLVTMQIRVSSVSSAEELKRKLVAALYDEDENRLVPDGTTPQLEVLDYLEIEITEDFTTDPTIKEKQNDEE
jgi:hypothetical protein